MKVEIISVGDEILSGNITDTNKTYISDLLWRHGFEVAFHTGVRDDAKTIQDALLRAVSRANVVLVTGGLGPTADDFTLEVAAKTFRKKLHYDQRYLEHLKKIFHKLGRELTENNKKQALIPQGAKVFDNKVGTAPGIGILYKKIPFYFMPGVPTEMKQLFADFILPDILHHFPKRDHFESVLLKCFGSAESELDAALKDLYKNRVNIQNVRIGFRPKFPETMIKLSAWHANQAKAKELLHGVTSLVKERLGEFIYGEGEDTLESVVGKLLLKNQKTVATAESCTGGMLANRITDISGSSGYFKNGVVSYSNESKITMLEVSPQTLERFGAVSSQCAREMAQGIRRVSKADYGIAITGIAGPSGGTREKPVGTVHIALANHHGTSEKEYVLPYRRDWFKLLVSSIALNQLRKELIKLKNEVVLSNNIK